MTRTRHTTSLAAAATCLVLAVGLGATTAPAAASAPVASSGPVLGAPGGCALQCIEKAWVVATAADATVEVGTTVPTKLAVRAWRLLANGTLAALTPEATAKTYLYRQTRIVKLTGLQPKTTYRIVVSATDTSGRTANRMGTFETRAVQTAVEPGPGTFSSGAGCSVKCITKAIPVHVGPTTGLFEVATNTPARITFVVSRNGSIASIVTSPSLTKSYSHASTGLFPGTKYDLFVRATDSQGRTEHHHFTFKTVERHARVTLWKIKVIDDGDKGVDRGEMRFEYYLGGAYVGGLGWHKRSSGDVFDVRANGTNRPGLTRVVPVNGPNPQLDARVFAEECDGYVLMKNCLIEAKPANWLPAGGSSSRATAGGTFSVNQLLAQGALPGNYGSMLPSGHDAYLVFETTKYGVKFRVYGYVDFFDAS